MILLSLDLALKTGYAVGPSDGKPLFGAYRIPHSPEDLGACLQHFGEWLEDSIAVHQPRVVVFEAPIFNAGKTSLATARLLYSLAGVTELICRRARVICREANLMTVKKFWAGTGRADKSQMMEAARRYGFDVKTSDEADALAIWAYAVHLLAPKHAERFALGQVGARA